MTTWQWSAFDDLSVADLYQVLQQRQQVFILEQTCFYNDFDGLDQGAHHLLGWRTADGAGAGKRELAAYLRVLAPGAKYTEMSIGRVLTSASARASGANCSSKASPMPSACIRATASGSARSATLSAFTRALAS